MSAEILVRNGSGAIVLFAHGFRTDAQTAFKRVGKLVPQGLALVVPSVKTSSDDSLPYKDINFVLAGLDKELPVIVVAHSGGYEAVLAWLKSDTGKRVKSVVLLDALYGGLKEFAEFSERGIMISVGITDEPKANTQKLVAQKKIHAPVFPAGVSHDAVHGMITGLVKYVVEKVTKPLSSILPWLGGLGAAFVLWRILRKRKPSLSSGMG